MKYKIITAMLLALFLSSTLAVSSSVRCSGNPDDFVVGASYMTFWGTGMNSDWSSGAVYQPILGSYSSSNTTIADQHIKWARDSGIHFFYLDYGWAEPADQRLMDNAAVNGLLKADGMKDFSFCIFYHPNRVLYTVGNLSFVNETGIREDFFHMNETYFNYSQYLRLDNRRVVILADFPEYQNKSLTDGEVNSLFLNLTETYGLYLIPAFWPNSAPGILYGSAGLCYGSITLWGLNTIIEFNKTISYSEYVNKTKEYFQKWVNIAAKFGVGFVPLICPGYNNMIYAYMNNTPNRWWGIVNRDPEGFREVCQLAKNYSTLPYHMILLFTWNDFKEATSIEPTTDYGYTYLNIISSELGTTPISHVEIILYGIPIAVVIILVAVFVIRRKKQNKRVDSLKVIPSKA
jgi:hypothetical protein